MPAQIQIGGGDAGTPGLQTLTMTNSSSAATAGTTIVQYAQGPDGQFFIPGTHTPLDQYWPQLYSVIHKKL